MKFEFKKCLLSWIISRSHDYNNPLGCICTGNAITLKRFIVLGKFMVSLWLSHEMTEESEFFPYLRLCPYAEEEALFFFIEMNGSATLYSVRIQPITAQETNHLNFEEMQCTERGKLHYFKFSSPQKSQQ